jgi:hypothetical protein
MDEVSAPHLSYTYTVHHKYGTNETRKIISLSYFEKCVVRRIFLEYSELNKDILPFHKCYVFKKNKIGYQGENETFRKTLKGMGFSFKKCKTDDLY